MLEQTSYGTISASLFRLELSFQVHLELTYLLTRQPPGSSYNLGSETI